MIGLAAAARRDLDAWAFAHHYLYNTGVDQRQSIPVATAAPCRTGTLNIHQPFGWCLCGVAHRCTLVPQAAVKTELLKCMTAETRRGILRKVCSVVVPMVVIHCSVTHVPSHIRPHTVPPGRSATRFQNLQPAQRSSG